MPNPNGSLCQHCGAGVTFVVGMPDWAPDDKVFCDGCDRREHMCICPFGEVELEQDPPTFIERMRREGLIETK